jgi:hypothetical protein
MAKNKKPRRNIEEIMSCPIEQKLDHQLDLFSSLRRRHKNPSIHMPL